MAKIKGGLFSNLASGSLGNIITYQGRRFFRHVHRKADPYNPNSTAQSLNRSLFADAAVTWQLLSAADKYLYNSKSSLYNNITGFNIFISTSKGFTIYWIQYNKAKFGMTKKYGGPAASRLR